MDENQENRVNDLLDTLGRALIDTVFGLDHAAGFLRADSAVVTSLNELGDRGRAALAELQAYQRENS